VHRSPANGPKFILNSTRVRCVFDQSVASLYAAVPNSNSVFVSDLMPTVTMKNIKNKMKITPNEPTLINIDKSFFIVSRMRIGYIMKPQ
jgi:hypothetical protein